MNTVDALEVFNAAEMRTKGTELEKYVKRQGRGIKVSGKGAGGKNKTRTMSSREFDETPVRARGGAKPSKWRQQSSQFREAIRQVGNEYNIASEHANNHDTQDLRTTTELTGLLSVRNMFDLVVSIYAFVELVGALDGRS